MSALGDIDVDCSEAAAPKLGKRCVLAPGGARNTFRFPPGLATGNDGETQLCCFKSCVGAKLYVGSGLLNSVKNALLPVLESMLTNMKVDYFAGSDSVMVRASVVDVVHAH